MPTLFWQTRYKQIIRPVEGTSLYIQRAFAWYGATAAGVFVVPILFIGLIGSAFRNDGTQWISMLLLVFLIGLLACCFLMSAYNLMQAIRTARFPVNMGLTLLIIVFHVLPVCLLCLELPGWLSQ